MALADTIRGAVGLANNIFGSQQLTVIWEACTKDSKGKRAFADPVNIQMLVDWTQRTIVSKGLERTSRATMTLLDPSIVIGPDDRLTLPDGMTGPIVQMTGPADPATGKPYVTEISIA